MGGAVDDPLAVAITCLDEAIDEVHVYIDMTRPSEYRDLTLAWHYLDLAAELVRNAEAHLAQGFANRTADS